MKEYRGWSQCPRWLYLDGSQVLSAGCTVAGRSEHITIRIYLDGRQVLSEGVQGLVADLLGVVAQRAHVVGSHAHVVVVNLTRPWPTASQRKEGNVFYLTTHSTHFIYGYMASDIWLRTILIVRKETRCRHIGYSYGRLTARVLLYAPSHRQDNTYHGLCYTSRGALAGTRK